MTFHNVELNLFESCFMSSLWCELPHNIREAVWSNIDFGPRNNLWMEILKSDILMKKIDITHNVIYMFSFIVIESLDPTIISRVIKSGLLDHFEEEYQRHLIISIVHRGYYLEPGSDKTKRIMESRHIMDNHPLRINQYNIMKKLLDACNKLRSHNINDICWMCPTISMAKLVNKQFLEVKWKEDWQRWHEQGNKYLDCKDRKGLKKYIKKHGKKPSTWSPNIHKLYPDFIRSTILYILMVSKLRFHCELSDLPNELLFMIYSKF